MADIELDSGRPGKQAIEMRLKGDQLAVHQPQPLPDPVAADVAGIENGNRGAIAVNEFAVDVHLHIVVARILQVRLTALSGES